MKIFISPPFGNYVHYVPCINKINKNIIPILGSYTTVPRKGLVRQIFKTVRYNWDNQGWVNRIGLRNKGLTYGIKEYCTLASKNKEAILSIGLTTPADIPLITKIVPNSVNIEINLSCPNINPVNIEDYIEQGLSQLNCQERKYNIIKLPHNITLHTVDKLYECGFRQFHCSNTKITPFGALSGPALRQKNLSTIEELYRRYFGEIELIGGGGIQEKRHIDQYRWAGAEHVSLASVLFNPYKTYGLLKEINK